MYTYASLTLVAMLCPISLACQTTCHPVYGQGIDTIGSMSFSILLPDQRCFAGSAKVSMRPDGHAGLGPDGHCDVFAQLGANVCSESYGMLAFVQQNRKLFLVHSP